MTPVLHVRCPRAILQGFHKTAAGHFPKESYAVLFGRRRGNRIWIRDVWYPEDQQRRASRAQTQDVVTHHPWKTRADAIAESEGLFVVGDFHSHTDSPAVLRANIGTDEAPSAGDWDRAGLPDKWIQIICHVHRTRRGLRTKVRVWPEIKKVKLEVV